MQKIQKFLNTPYYFQWLIVFFVLHGYSDFIGLIKLSSLALLLLQVSIAAWILFFLFGKIYRSSYKAAILVTVIFFCYLFFGAIQDNCNRVRLLFPLSLFVVLLPVLAFICLALFAALFIYKKPLSRLTTLLNVLLLVYIGYDILLISWRAQQREKNKPAPVITINPVADTINKPDVYFILLDEYAGSAALHDYFNYDNSGFESFLKQKGFYVCSKPTSNYSYTVFSMASLFSMRYLDSFDLGSDVAYRYKRMAELINNNAVCEYFKRFNYTIRNFSPFEVLDKDASTSVTVLPRDINLLTDKMAYNRIIKRIVLGEPQSWLNVSLISTYLNRNIAASHENQMQSALSSATKNSPAFTYVHLLMPHKPFIYDSTGKKTNAFKEVSVDRNSGADKLYLQYLVYTNKRISKFIEQLYTATNGKAVIIVMSDHGYRDARGKRSKNFSFKSFNAIYLPSRDYHLWYDSVSNVNQFPLLFNTLFNQQIPLKKDSCKF